MDENSTNEESKKEFNQLDLSQLESFDFGTQWSRDKSETDDASRHSRDDRPRREGGGRDNRKDRRGFKKPQGSGGDDRGGGGRRHGGDQHRARDSSGRGGHGRDRRQDGGRPSPHVPYVSPHFEATFYPEDVSFAALAKTIRVSARTFELFDIARTVIGKNDRFVVVLERKSGPTREGSAPQPFHVCLLDGIPFETEEAAINHVAHKHLHRFFVIGEQEAEPPKGSFQVVNKCGVTGELLAPPNYHLYTQIVQQHHASRLPRMGFENFTSRIESVRDPAVIEQWLESMKKVTRYTWLQDEPVPIRPEASPAVQAEASSPPETSPAEPATPEMDPAGDSAESAEPQESISADAPPDEPAASSPGEEPAVAPEPAPTAGPVFDSVNEAKAYLLTHARDRCVRTYEHGRFHGHVVADMPDGEIKRAVIGSLERQQRFPLDTANALRGRLRREGFTIFKKGSKGISYVSAVKRKFRVAGQAFADSINDLITFVEQNPMVKVSELPKKFLQIVPRPSPAEEKGGKQPVTGMLSLFGEADQPRVKRMHLDLRWLVTEGYVTEFIDGTLFAPPPMPAAKPKAEKPVSTARKTDAASPPAAENVPEETSAATAADPITPASPPSAPVEADAASTGKEPAEPETRAKSPVIESAASETLVEESAAPSAVSPVPPPGEPQPAAEEPVSTEEAADESAAEKPAN